MNRLTQHGSIDLYHTTPLPRASRVIMFNENEHGHAGYIALKALVGDAKPMARLCSHLLGTIAYNQTKEPASLGWEVYYADDTYLININEWPSTPLFPVEDSKAAWIYTYPVIRDTLKALAQHGVEQLLFCGSTAIHEALDEEQFPSWNDNVFVNIVFEEGTPTFGEDDIFFTPPTWLFPEVAYMMGLRSEAVMSGYDEDLVVDFERGYELADYLKSNWLINTKLSKKAARKAADEMQDYNDRADKIRSEMESAIKTKPANNTMWG
jgi:hypothetical protein